MRCFYDDGEGVCHANEETECPENAECEAVYDIHGNNLNEMANNERLRDGY